MTPYADIDLNTGPGYDLLPNSNKPKPMLTGGLGHLSS